MLTKPLVSVLMSIYKEPIEWIRLSIDSILNQSFTDFEYIIICDNPNYKEGIELLEEYREKDKRIVLIYNETNIGLTKSLNMGIAIAKGKYIARMDADDVSMPTRLEEQVIFMNSHPNVIVCGSKVEFFGEVPLTYPRKWIKYTNTEIKASLILNSCFVHPSVLIRKNVLDENNILYDEEYRHAQDYRLWECLQDFGEYANIEIPLLRYRVSKRQISNSSLSSQINYASKIRRRIVQRCLDNLGIDSNNIDGISVSQIKQYMKKCSEKELLPYYNSLIKLYYTIDNKKSYANLIRVLTGCDINRFSIWEIYRFVLINLGLTKGVEI